MSTILVRPRLTSDDLEILADARRDRIARDRPGQLAERKKLVAQLAPDPAAAKQEQAHAEEVKAAEQAVREAHLNLERAEDHVSDLWRRSHGQSHAQNTREADTRARLRALAHPAIPVVIHALIRADHAACAVAPSIIGHEILAADTIAAEDTRRRWSRPFVAEETIRPISSHGAQLTFLEAIRAARVDVENLLYQDLADDVVLTILRATLDAILRASLPPNLHHVRAPLATLRHNLDGDPLDLAEEVIE